MHILTGAFMYIHIYTPIRRCEPFPFAIILLKAAVGFRDSAASNIRRTGKFDGEPFSFFDFGSADLVLFREIIVKPLVDGLPNERAPTC